MVSSLSPDHATHRHNRPIPARSKARHDQHAQCCRPWQLLVGCLRVMSFTTACPKRCLTPETMRQCAVGKDNMDTALGYPHEADGVADTSPTQFFSEGNGDTSRPRPKRVNMLLVPDRNTGPTLRANHDTGPAALPECILFARPLTTPACSHVPPEDCTQPVTETVQRRITTNSIIVMGRERSTFQTLPPTSPFGSHGPVSVRATSN